MTTDAPLPPLELVAPGPPSSDTDQPSRAAQFHVGTLHRADLDPNPVTQFHAWFSDPRIASAVPEACTLATAHLPSGRVSARIVYLKELDERGWVIYSNWGTSHKARDWESNKWVSLCFWWQPVERQVRVEGRGERLTDQESQPYFDTRSRGSRLGAWASSQSAVLRPRPDTAEAGATTPELDDGRSELEEQVRQVDERFRGQEHIPVPPFWGGLRVVPDTVEFWQGRDSRLHDRFCYQRTDRGQWSISRLSP
jgi:pyridoxamine 5'-phosphate oxidase